MTHFVYGRSLAAFLTGVHARKRLAGGASAYKSRDWTGGPLAASRLRGRSKPALQPHAGAAGRVQIHRARARSVLEVQAEQNMSAEPIVVMGIVVEGAENASRVRKVIVISMLFAVLIITNSVLQQVEDKSEPMERLMGLLLGLLVPACGYIGAKRSDRALLGCFWGCNAFSAVCNTTAVGMWLLIITMYRDDVLEAYEMCYGDYCEVGGSGAGWSTDVCLNQEACRDVDEIIPNQTRCLYHPPKQPHKATVQEGAPLVGGRTCPEIKRSYDMITKEKWDLHMMVMLGIMTVVLNSCACWHGKRLFDENVLTNPTDGYSSRHSMTPILVQVRIAQHTSALVPVPNRSHSR